MKLLSGSPSLIAGILLGTGTLLTGCGGTSSSSSQSTPAVASAAMTFQLAPVGTAGQAGGLEAKPHFHLAPVILAEPDNRDAFDNAASAQQRPVLHAIPPEFQQVSSKGLTLQKLQALRHNQKEDTSENLLSPLATPKVVMTFTPAQIRSAYSLPALPATGTAPTSAQAAAMGAGQTIYIVDAQHDPNAAAELAAFNQQFGLPGCTTTVIAANASLPLAAASPSTCQFSVVYSTTNATMTTTAPAYDSGWATEIALDVQWAHATAPLARIILIEAPDASGNSLTAAVNLANAMGPGAVSMSFGSSEGSWTSAYESIFSVANMTYLAATGDSGVGVEWPSVSPHVLAVGGTSLTYSGSGTRTETAWSNTGGGVSAFVAAPSYQSNTVPGVGSQSYRTVADVSFNADPNTGQYLAVMSQGSTSVSWMSAGGTSLSTPQWAGIVAIANAQRAQAAKGYLGQVQPMLYGQIATSASNYSSAFLDVTQGADGSCTTCTAHTGYDDSTGLGTPNVSNILTQLSGGAAAPAPAPVVTPAGISATVGVPLAFTVSVTASNPVTYSVSGQPSGLTISTAGAVSWAAPVAGTYPVTVTAKDSKTGLSGSGVYTITVNKSVAPVVTAQSISGKAGTALSFTVSVTAQNPLTFSLTSQPSGMTVSSAGVVSWPAPVAGNYSVTVTAKDSKTGLSGSNVFKIAIAAAAPPAVTGANINGTAGTALSFTAVVSATNPVTYTLSGAPSGMAVSSTGVVSWSKPVAGKYAVTVTAKDSVTGLSGSGVFNVSINAAGPQIVASSMVAKVGTTLTGTITITDPGATSLNVSISGVPMGMSFAMNGLTLNVSWANPVVGNYTMLVAVTDSAGLTSQLSVPVTITAK